MTKNGLGEELKVIQMFNPELSKNETERNSRNKNKLRRSRSKPRRKNGRIKRLRTNSMHRYNHFNLAGQRREKGEGTRKEERTQVARREGRARDGED